MKVAERLLAVKEYYFSKKLREVKQLMADGKPIINMGIGSPDLPPPPAAVEHLQSVLGAPSAHQYQSYQGLPELRVAMTDFYERRFGVELDSNKEILPLIGSKEGIMHISMAFLNPGDGVLVPNPGYPTYASVAKLLDARMVPYNLTEENGWLPNLEEIASMDLTDVKIMWISYPNMPTGATIKMTDMESLVAFAKQNDILLVNDNPYSFVLNDKPTSILQVSGAKEVSLELNSLSKTFNMAGWRVGMVMGSTEHILAVLKVKSNMDSGMFYGIQQGAIAALKSADEWYSNLDAVYAERRELMFQLVEKLGCVCDKNTAGMFVWAKLPQSAPPAEEFIDAVLHKHHIFIAPGTIFGSNGEGYIRFSLCVKKEKIEEAIQRFD